MLNILTLELADPASILPEVPEELHHTFLLSHITDIWRRVSESFSVFPEGQEIFLHKTFKVSLGWWLWHSLEDKMPRFSRRLWKPKQNQRISALSLQARILENTMIEEFAYRRSTCVQNFSYGNQSSQTQ